MERRLSAVGHVPIGPMPTNASQAQAWLGPRLRREMGGRTSRLRWRRRRAYRALLTMIKIREAQLGWRDDPWLPRAPAKSEDSPFEKPMMETILKL